MRGALKGAGVRETSALRCAEASRTIFSRPRSSLSERIIAWISLGDSNGLRQNVHGPRPSLTQMILPQLRQLGAAARRGCRVALQSQRRAEMSLILGLVCSSRERMAESSSVRAVEAPCMGMPPVMFTLVLGAGEEVREAGALFEVGLKSDMRWPAADGGVRDVGGWVTAGWF